MALTRTTTSGLRIPATPTGPAPRRSSAATKWLAGALLVLLAATGFLGYQLYTLKANPNLQSQKELDQIVKKVGRLVILPENETPTLATVSDPDKLKDQPFFANAKTGFKVLFYTQAKKAILYDPDKDRVVEIAPINPNAAPPDTSSQTGNQGGTTQTPSSTTP